MGLALTHDGAGNVVVTSLVAGDLTMTMTMTMTIPITMQSSPLSLQVE